MNRKIPRSPCSFECRLEFDNGFKCDAYLVDISANGGAVSPVSPSDISEIKDGDLATMVVDLKSAAEVDSCFTAVVKVRWSKGTLVGAEIVEVDTPNFKKWLVLLCKSYF